LIDDFRTELAEDGILAAIEAHDTPKLFDWIVPAFSYQGIADAIGERCRSELVGLVKPEHDDCRRWLRLGLSSFRLWFRLRLAGHSLLPPKNPKGA
jgi:hypothetical protein